MVVVDSRFQNSKVWHKGPRWAVKNHNFTIGFPNSEVWHLVVVWLWSISDFKILRFGSRDWGVGVKITISPSGRHFRRSFQITRALLFTKFKKPRWTLKFHDFHNVFPSAKG